MDQVAVFPFFCLSSDDELMLRIETFATGKGIKMGNCRHFLRIEIVGMKRRSSVLFGHVFVR